MGAIHLVNILVTMQDNVQFACDILMKYFIVQYGTDISHKQRSGFDT